jgi:hypothetical protein
VATAEVETEVETGVASAVWTAEAFYNATPVHDMSKLDSLTFVGKEAFASLTEPLSLVGCIRLTHISAGAFRGMTGAVELPASINRIHWQRRVLQLASDA